MTRRDHDWYRQRLALFRAGLLPEAAALEVRDHLPGCEACRVAAEAMLADRTFPDVEAGHIPAGYLARWPRVRREVSGLRRTLFRRHLEDCQACRDNLRMIGQDPVLEVVPELELANDPLAGLEPGPIPITKLVAVVEPEPVDQPVRRPVRPESRARAWVWARWLVPAWATAATALVVLATMRPGMLPFARTAPVGRDTVYVPTPIGHGPDLFAGATGVRSLQEYHEPLPEQLRSSDAGGAIPEIAVGPHDDLRVLDFDREIDAHPGLKGERGRSYRATVTLMKPDGSQDPELVLTLGDLLRQGYGLRLDPAHLATGIFTLHARFTSDRRDCPPDSIVRQFRFRRTAG